MICKICVVVLMCGVFCLSSIGSVVEASSTVNVSEVVTTYDVAGDIKDAATNKVKEKVTEKKEQAKKRAKDSINKKIDSVLKF